MKDARIVWSDENGDQRKSKKNNDKDQAVNEAELELKIRRLTAGKGRVVIEISGLPSNTSWCKKLASNIKKSLGVGGAYKNDLIEVHVPELDKVSKFLDKQGLRWKKTGG